jgi:pantetheine-phosphate adenylyltransferase
MPKALYPGSFDPITYGHVDIVRRARKLFDELIIAVMLNPTKTMLFSLEERRQLVESVLREEGLSGVSVLAHDGLMVELARKLGVSAVIRGLRVTADFEYEWQLALTNRDLDPQIESVFLMTSREYSFISSSIVREVKRYGGDVSNFVPKVVEAALETKFSLRAKS